MEFSKKLNIPWERVAFFTVGLVLGAPGLVALLVMMYSGHNILESVNGNRELFSMLGFFVGALITVGSFIE